MQEINTLFHRYINNECNPEEIRTLLTHFGQEKDSADLKLLILEQLNADIPTNFEQQPHVIDTFKQTDDYLNRKLFRKKTFPPILTNLYVRYAVAASIVILFSIGTYSYLQQQKEKTAPDHAMVNDAKPAADKAMLTLADGTSITLDENGSTAVLNDKGIKIRKTKDGMLVYEVGNPPATNGVLGFNQLRTPKGAKYEILLPDGTKVWLNAYSSLKYPLVFSANERRVELVGEAYFQVEKVHRNNQNIPFFVETPTQIVQVLGTEFNISAYEDDTAVMTTLMSGKVNVYGRSNNQHKILSPGEQSIITGTDDIKVIKTNLETVKAWKNGNFMYEDVYLKEILKQLSRWYDVEVDYTNVPQTRYNILVSRNETLSRVLRMLEKTGNIKFRIINNTIQINP